MTFTSNRLITLLGVVAVVMVYILLGRYPNNFPIIISGALLVCGLILLFIVNAHVGKKDKDGSAPEQQDDATRKEDDAP